MKRLPFALALIAAAWTGACGGGGSTIQAPPPSGKYSLASLKGTYAFATNGEVLSSNANFPSPIARVGSFVADGTGKITSGIEDVNTAGTPSNAIVITGGSYTVSADGRGSITLNFQNGGAVNFGIVLTSTGDGLMIDETSNSNQASTGSGNFVLQQSTAFTISELSGNYVFDFTGLDGATNPNPESFIGVFNVDKTTETITGIFDDNDGGSLASNAPMAPGTISQDPLQLPSFSSFGRGIATIDNQDFVFYIVNSNQVRFLSTNKGMLSGDAILQSNNIPANAANLSGGFAFIVGGSSGNGGITRVGRFTANGASVSNVVMDTNSAGTFHQTGGNEGHTVNGASVSLDPSTPGRGTLTFTDTDLGFTSKFVFYLSSATSGVIQEVSVSNANNTIDVADGSMLAQSGNSFSSSNITGTYAMNWSGLVVAGGSFPVEDEEDLVSQVTISNLSLSGTSDVFQFTSLDLAPVTNLGTTGQISMNGGDGASDDGIRVTMGVKLSNQSGTINMVVYIASPQVAFFADQSNSSGRIVAGVLKAQQ